MSHKKSLLPRLLNKTLVLSLLALLLGHLVAVAVAPQIEVEAAGIRLEAGVLKGALQELAILAQHVQGVGTVGGDVGGDAAVVAHLHAHLDAPQVGRAQADRDAVQAVGRRPLDVHVHLLSDLVHLLGGGARLAARAALVARRLAAAAALLAVLALAGAVLGSGRRVGLGGRGAGAARSRRLADAEPPRPDRS